MAQTKTQPDFDPDAVEITLHFSDGSTLKTSPLADDVEDYEDLDEYLKSVLREPGHPHWARIGDIYFFTGAVKAISGEEKGA